MKPLDFDKFISEKDKEYIEVAILGEVYQVKKIIPAIVPVAMARVERAKTQSEKEALNLKMVLLAAESMLGSNAVDELCAKGLSTQSLASIVGELFKAVNSHIDEKEDNEEEIRDDDAFVAKDAPAKKSQ